MTKKTPDKPGKKSSKSKTTKKTVTSSVTKKEKQVKPEADFGYQQSPRYFMLSDRAKATADALEIDIDTIEHVYVSTQLELLGQCVPMEESVDILLDDSERISKTKNVRDDSNFFILNPFQVIFDDIDGVTYFMEFNQASQFPIVEINTRNLPMKPVSVSIEYIERYLTALEYQFDLTDLLDSVDSSIERSEIVKNIDVSDVKKEEQSNVIQFKKYLDRKKNNSK